MRIPLIALAGLLYFSHATAQDQLIKLPKPAEFDVVSKSIGIDAAADPAKPDPVKDVVIKDSAGLKDKIAASDDAASKPAPKPATKPAAADDDDDNLQEVAAKIAAKLAALRQERESRPKAPARKKVARAAEPVKEATPVSFAARQHHPAHWSYEGEGGPHNWGKLNPAWAACENGSRQSPIDIRDGIKVDLETIAFNYKPARFSVLDNGHTVQVSVTAGNTITVTGRTYELVQFHFHHPGEERINGKGFPMVVHLVHKDAQGSLAVIAVLIEEGSANPVVQQIWNDLPLERNTPVLATAIIDLTKLLPERREYYTYMGSLTTPPCSEGVLWMVFKQPIQLSDSQIGIFSRLYPMNARPIQAQMGRMIKESN